ncbi:MAG: autotransporter-associated beta strand repeat-containing protein, partial [Patescibacteria group bacterium]|nr:autotransporter-associated beta strand repeat-containing protein [Patescibacteria group bacterium]
MIGAHILRPKFSSQPVRIANVADEPRRSSVGFAARALGPHRIALRCLVTALVVLSGISASASVVMDWGVGQSGMPGVYSWQHLYNWTEPGTHLSPSAVPNGVGHAANFSRPLSGNQTVLLDGPVTLGTLNLGDAGGRWSYTLAPGTGGSLALNNGGTAEINKTGVGTDVISANLALTDSVVVNVGDGRLILDGIISGTGGITKTGDGWLVLRRSNTYTGLTTLNGGITLINQANNDNSVLGTTGSTQGTIINNGATLAIVNDGNDAGSTTTGGASLNSEPISVAGSGYLNQGAIRSYGGREQNQFTGPVTATGDTRFQSQAGTFHFSGTLDLGSHDLRIGGTGYTSLGGPVQGTGTITHFGSSGFRMQNHSASNTFSGAIVSELGEVRAENSDTTTGANPYSNVSSLTVKNGVFLIMAPTSGTSAVQNRVPDAMPITLQAGRIRIENTNWSNSASAAWAETVGAVTSTLGHTYIDFRDTNASSGTRLLKMTSFTRSDASVTLQLHGDGGVPAAFGTSDRYRVVNSALTGGGNVAFVGGWAYTNAEFMKYNDPGDGYRALEAANYSTNTAETAWSSGQNIKFNDGNRTLTGDRTIQSLNIQGGTGRTLGGNAGTTLTIESGGLLTSGGTHVISVPYLTAGAAGDYHLYDIAWSTNIIRSVIADNGGNAVSLVKAGGGTTSLLGNNTYTGTTFINEGMLREVIGARNITGLGSGNLTIAGGPTNQSVYETDRHFTRSLGSGAGEVQIVSGTGSGFSAYGAPVNLDFGGAGQTVTWGSATFNPGMFTLNGGNATHVVTLVNPVDLGNEQRYIRLDGSSSGGNRAVIGVMAGDLFNGGIVKRGGGVLVLSSPKTYNQGSIVNEGELWLRGAGTAGANVVGNDIMVNQGARLKLDGPANVGSRQLIALNNTDDNNPAAIAFGAGYGDGSEIRFHTFLNQTDGAGQLGPYDIFLHNQQTGDNRRNRVAVQISGNHEFANDVMAQIKLVAPDVETWFGADTGNGTFVGTSLSATGRNKTGGLYAIRLGSGGGTLTIANENVLSGNAPLVVGAEDNSGRTNIGGLVYLPNAQNYTGTVTQTVGTSVTAGNLIGAGGILVVGQDGALNAGNNNISLRSGEIRFGINADNSFLGGVDSQYGSRNLVVRGGTGTVRTIPLAGGSFGTLELNELVMRMDDGNRTLALNSIGTHYTTTVVKGTTTLENGDSNARNAEFSVGNDNSFHSGVGVLVLEGVVGQTGTAAISMHKRNGGVLVLKADNTYSGTTNVQQGRLVLANTGAAGNEGSTINLNTNSDRRSDLEFRMDGTGPFVFNNVVATTGGNDGSTRVITVGSYDGSSSNQVVRIPTLTIGHDGTYSVNGTGSSALYFDGFNGYQLEVTGGLNLNRSTVLRTRGALVRVSGVLAGAAANTLEKSEDGTLWLSGNNTYAGPTVLSQGYLVAAHDNAFGTATSNITIRHSASSQLLASGERTISRIIQNTATGGTQTIGGLDAGAKTFSGNIFMTSRGVSLTAATGGDTTFTGILSGGHGITKVGDGIVVLNPAGGTGNTYTGATIVNGGTLVGVAPATSGSPFGVNGAFTVGNGNLILQGIGAAKTVSTTGSLSVNAGNAVIGVHASAGFATQFTFGSLARSNNATVVFKGGATDLGTAGLEKVSFTTAPSLTNGAIGTWAVIGGQGLSDNSAHYAGFSGGNVVTATYGGSGDLNTATGATQLFNAGTTGGTLTADRSVYAFRTNAGVDLGGFTLNLGNGGQAGMILNAGADVTNGTVNFGQNVLSVYTDDAAVSTLGAQLTNYRNNSNNTLTTSLIKFGPGTLEIATPTAFQGHVSVNQGVLSLAVENAIATVSNLGTVTGAIVTIQPGATVRLNGFNQEFGNLAGINQGADFQYSGGTLDLGGATLVVGRENSPQTFSGQLIGGAGSVLQKVGTGTLNLWNYNGNRPNSLDTLRVDQGTLASRNNDQSWATPTAYASAIPSSTNVELRGGTWQVRVVGDSTSNFQAITLGNNVSVYGSNGVLSTLRDQGGASNKIVVFNDLTLNRNLLTVTGDNSNYPRFDGTVTLTREARVQTDTPLILTGEITGHYALTKTGGSNLEIAGDNRNWAGGTVLHDGTLLFGTRAPENSDLYMAGSNLFSYSATANLGTGDIVVNRSTAIRINAPTNILSDDGSRVQVFGAIQNSLPRVDLGVDAPLTAYNIRSTSNGALTIGLNDGFFANTIDQSMLGDGRWQVGAWTTSFYTASTFGAGVDGVFRFGGTNGSLGITQSHALSGDARLEVGADMVPNGWAIGNGNASVRIYGDQSYTGNTIIRRNREAGSTQNFLELMGTNASPVFDVYGRLTIRGAGRFTNDAGNQVNVVNLHPGSTLRLDYSMDVNDTMLISRLQNSNLGWEATENKWADDAAMFLDGATLNMVNSSGRVNRERVGAITVRTGAAVYLERNGTNGQIILEAPSITRLGQATFAVRENTDQLGRVDLESIKFFIDNGSTMLDAQGLMPVWMINPSRNTFLTYNNDLGVQNAAFTNSFTSGDATAAAAFLNGLTSTSVASFGGGLGDPTLAGTVNVHALRVAAVAGNETTFTGGQINIHSGGLIAQNVDSTGRVNFNTTNVYFGNGSTPVEGVVYNAANNVTTRIGGVVTAAGLTTHGIGNLQLTNTGNQISGNIQMNGGKLYLDGAGTAGAATITLGGDWLQNNDGNQMAELWLRTNDNANQTWNNSVIIGQNVPYARIYGSRYTGTSTSTGTNTIQNLTIEGTDTLQGTSLIIGTGSTTESANTHNLTVAGLTTIGGSAAVGFRVENSGRMLLLGGSVTGSAPIFKSGDGVLRLDGNNTGFTSDVTLNRGEIRGVGNNSNNFFGTGDYTLNFGTLGFYTSLARTVMDAPDQSITIGGAVTLVRDRNSGTTNQIITLGAVNGTNTIRTQNGANLRIASNGWGDDWAVESKLIVNDSATLFNDNAVIYLRDQLVGGGRLTRLGIWNVYFDSNAPNTDWTGTLDLQAGMTRMLRDNDTLGGIGSSVILNPAASLTLRTVGNLGTGNGLTQLRTTSATSHTVLGIGLAAEFTNLRAHFNGITTIGNRNGVLALDGGANVSVDPNMANFQNGNWYFGGVSGSGTLSANSVAPWGPSGNQFLIGGGGATLTLNPATAGSDQFGGAGNQMVIGTANNIFGYITTVFGSNANNTYGGGTLVHRSRNMDGGYRGSVISLQGGQTGASTYRTPLGSGVVDVFGEIRIEGGSGTVRNDASTNANSWVFHPGSRIRFDNGSTFGYASTEGRWADNVGITLNGSGVEIYGANSNHADNREKIGDLTVMRGGEVILRRRGSNWAELVAGDLTRSGTATLMITGMVDGSNSSSGLGVTGTASAMRLLVNNGASLMNNNMVAPWIIDRAGSQFMKYDATGGFQPITTGGSPSNYVATSTTTLTAGVIGANDGTRIVSLDGGSNFTLGDNLDLYALRLSRDINQSSNGQFQNIIIRSGGLTQYANTPTINANLYFGSSGLGDGEALIHASNNALQINGKIYASQVTKFGTSELYIRSDQPHFTGAWVVNGGALRFQTPGAQGSGEVILNGSRANDRDNTFNLTEVRYQFNSGSPDLFTWTGGKITAYDVNRIYAVTASDRLQQIPDVDLRTTNAVPGTGQEGLAIFLVDGARTTIRTGTVTLYDHYQVQVESNSYGTGSTAGFQFGSGDGTGGLNNQGLFDLRKVGDGVLTLGDNSATFTGGRSIMIGEGAVRVTHNGSLGGSGITANIEQGGVLEIATANFNPLATLVQQPGSMERWAVDGARAGATVTLASGVHLQIFHNQTGTQTIHLNGGSIMGYLPRDWDHIGVIHQLGAGITINLLADSFLGQPFASSNNSLWDQDRLYDIGKINQTTASNPNDAGLRGSYLQIHGAITGTGGLTKVGQDLILLTGASTYQGATVIENGTLQIGRHNALPVGTDLRLETSSGMFDLNGFDQEVASLSGDAGSVNNGAFAYNTLTVNQTATTTFTGTLDGNVTLKKAGTGVLTLAPVTALGDTTAGNAYRGGTVFEGGTLAIAMDAALGWTRNAAQADNLRFAGGTLRTTEDLTLHANRGVTLDAAGGTLETVTGKTLQVDGIVTGTGPLSKTGDGILQLNNAGNDYSGATHIAAGTLRGGAANTLSANSRHVVAGGAVSGTLALAGLDQTVGSLASTGSAQANATVALSSTLTVGADGTQDAVYAGAITGLASSVFRVNGPGAVQTLSTFDNSDQPWSTEIANGTVNVANNGRLGSGSVTLGIAGVSRADAYAGLNLHATTGFANAVTVTNVNSAGSTAITASGGHGSITGAVTLGRDVFVGAASGSQLSFEGSLAGDGRVTVINGGALRLTQANSYGSAGGVAGTSGSPMAGGTIVRAGTVLLENNLAAGVNTVVLGDASHAIGAAVDRATFSSILGGGQWNPNGGTSGFGAFTAVSATVDGNTYVAGDVGKRLLIAGEEANPERNGVYTITAVSGDTMTLVRAADFETGGQMTYGGQVAVSNGTYAGQTMFMFEENVVVRNESPLNPIRFQADVVNPDVAVLQNIGGLTTANRIDLNATNGTGIMTVGGSSAVTTGTGLFSGAITLQDALAGVAESKTVNLASYTAEAGGIRFTNVLSAADQTGLTADVLSVNKIGTGTVTLEAANTYLGTTTVTAGTLHVGTGGTASTRAAGSTGFGATTVNPGAMLLGTGRVNGVAGSTVHVLNGAMAPGDFL